MTEDNQQQIEYNKAVAAQQMAYRLYNDARYNQRNPYLSQQTPLVQRYYNYYQNKDEAKIQEENKQFEFQVQREQKRLGTTTGPLTTQQVASSRAAEQQYFQNQVTKTITPTQQQIIQGPSQASSFDFSQFNKQNSVLKSGGEGGFTAAVNVGNNKMQDYFFRYSGSQITSAKGLGTPMDIGYKQPFVNLVTERPSLQQFMQPSNNSLISAFNQGPKQTKNISPIGQNVLGGRNQAISPQGENLRLSFGEGLQGVVKNIFNFQVIGQAQEPLTGIENYFRQAFFDPFKYVTKGPYQDKTGSDKLTLDIAKSSGYQTEDKFTFSKLPGVILFNTPAGLYRPTKEVIMGSPTRQELFETGKKELFASQGISYSGQLLGSYQNVLGESISSKETSLFQEALNQNIKSLGTSYQERIDRGELSLDIAQSKYKSDLDVLQKQYQEGLNLDINKIYSEKLTGSNGLFQNLKKYEQNIYTPKSEKAFNIALPASRIIGQTALLSTGISEVTLGAAALGQAYTYKDYVNYAGNFNEYSTSQKIIGGIGLGIEQAGVIVGLKTGYNQFNVEDLNLRIEGLSQAKGQLQGLSLQNLDSNQALLVSDVSRETSSGFANTRGFSKLTFNEYQPGKTSLEIFSGQVTKGQVYNPGTYSYLPISDISTSTAFVPHIFSDKTLKSVGSYPGLSNEVVDLSLGKSTYISKDLANIKEFKFYGITQQREGYTDIIAGYGKGTTLKLSTGSPTFSVSDYSISGNIKNIILPSEESFSNVKSFSFGDFSKPSTSSSSFNVLSSKENQIFGAVGKIIEKSSKQESSQIFKQLNINQLTSGISAGLGQSYGSASIGLSSVSQPVTKGLQLSLPTQSFLSSPQRSSFSTQSLLPNTKQLMSPLSSLVSKPIVIGKTDSGSSGRNKNKIGTGSGQSFFQDTSNSNKLINVPVSNVTQRLRIDQKSTFGNLQQQTLGFSGMSGFGGSIGGMGGFGFGSSKSLGGIPGFGMKNKGFSYRNVKPSFTAVALNLKGTFPKSMSVGNMNLGISPGELRLLPGGRSRKKSKSSKKSSPRKSSSKRSSKKRR